MLSRTCFISINENDGMSCHEGVVEKQTGNINNTKAVTGRSLL